MQLTDTQKGAIVLAGLLAWLFTERWPVALGTAVLMAIAITGYQADWWTAVQPFVVRSLVWLRLVLTRKEAGPGWQLYDVLLGYDELTGQPIIENLESLKCIIFAGTSGFGKTTWAQNFVDHLVSHHSANDLKLAIGDVKRVSYGPWRHIPHLICPVAKTKEEHERLITAVLLEMQRRQRLFEVYEDQFCESLDDYFRLSGVKLPRLVIIVDELADAIQPGDEAYDKLVTLLKMGRFVGVHAVLGTQRPSAKVLTGEVVSQVVTKLFTYMPNNREFGVVSMVPKELYEAATPTPGRFMLYTTRGQWRFMRVQRVSRTAMAKRARSLAGRPRRWEDMATVTAVSPDSLSWDDMEEADKLAAMRSFLDSHQATPSLPMIMEHFQISKPTARKFRRAVMEE